MIHCNQQAASSAKGRLAFGRSRQRGFTFIELLVSISIIAVLMSVAAVSYSDTNKRSRDAKRRADLETVRSALEICRANTGTYPANITGSVTCSDAVVTLETTPADPKNSGVHVYTYSRPTTTTYTLTAQLELPTDPTTYTLKNP